MAVWQIIYCVVALAAWRPLAGHLAYHEAHRTRGRRSPGFHYPPVAPKNGEWLDAIFIAFFLSLLWLPALVVYGFARSFPRARFLAVGAERKARNVVRQQRETNRIEAENIRLQALVNEYEAGKL